MEGVRAGLHMLSHLTTTLVLHIGFLFFPPEIVFGAPGRGWCAWGRQVCDTEVWIIRGVLSVDYKVQISLDSPRIGALPGFKLG